MHALVCDRKALQSSCILVSGACGYRPDVRAHHRDHTADAVLVEQRCSSLEKKTSTEFAFAERKIMAALTQCRRVDGDCSHGDGAQLFSSAELRGAALKGTNEHFLA